MNMNIIRKTKIEDNYFQFNVSWHMPVKESVKQFHHLSNVFLTLMTEFNLNDIIIFIILSLSICSLSVAGVEEEVSN